MTDYKRRSYLAAMDAGRRYAIERARPRQVTRIYEREVILRDGTIMTERHIVIEEVD